MKQSGQGRADDAGGVLAGGVQCDGVRQMLAVNQVGNDRVACREDERHNDAVEEGQQQNRPALDQVGSNQQREQPRDGHHADLGGHQHLAPVEAVDDNSGRKGQKQQWNAAGEPGQPNEEWRIGLLKREPADGDLIHPEGRVGRQRPHEQQPERLKRLQRVQHSGFFGRRDDRFNGRRA